MSLSWLRSASTAEAMSGYCSLQARLAPSRPVARCTWPSDAACAASCSKLLNVACQSGAQLARHAPAHERPAHRRRVGLQLRPARRRIRAAARREWWTGAARLSSADLSARRARLCRSAACLARSSLQSEIALARRPRREPADRAPDPRITPHAPAEGIAVIAAHGGIIAAFTESAARSELQGDGETGSVMAAPRA